MTVAALALAGGVALAVLAVRIRRLEQDARLSDAMLIGHLSQHERNTTP